MKKSIIFCVDDEKIVLDSLKTELKNSFGENYIIETAENAKEALKTIEELHHLNYEVPIIVSDYSMPIMKGDEFLKIIHEKYPKTLKILLTEQATIEGVANSINNANLYRYIAKPWETKDLILTVNQAIKSYNDQNIIEKQNNDLQELSQSLELKVEKRTKELSETNQKLIEKNIEIEKQNRELGIYRNHLEEQVSLRTAERNKAKQKAEESDKLKTAFLMNISHEIKTPMNGVLGFIDLLRSPETNEDDKRKFLDYIDNCSRHLLNIIADIIDISRIETNQVELKISTCELNSLQNNIFSLFDSHILRKPEVEFIYSFPIEMISFDTDELKLQQIITHLVNNAIRFTLKGTIEIGCSVTQNQELLFFVKDTGIGIAKEYLNQIFDRFRQVEVELARNHGGTGLGLSISKAYATILGGEIWIESELGKGTTFFLKIPCNPLVKQEITPTKTTVSANFNNITILVAEDDETNFILLNYVLSKWNTNIIRATNGAEAVEICLKNENIDLVLMDIKMPVLDGLNATKQILKFRSNLPIIAQTANAFPEDIKIALDAGCIDYISKPFNIELLMSKISKYLTILSY